MWRTHSCLPRLRFAPKPMCLVSALPFLAGTLVGTGRFELPTCRLGGGRSIHLSYVPTTAHPLFAMYFFNVARRGLWQLRHPHSQRFQITLIYPALGQPNILKQFAECLLDMLRRGPRSDPLLRVPRATL
jgi:hypothetical protein